MDLQLNKESLSQVLPTKGNIEKVSAEIIQDVVNGWVDPFETLARMEAVKSMCDEVREGTADFVRTELEKYGKEGHKALDAKFELAEVGIKYDYSNDPVWMVLNDRKKFIDVEMKEQEKFLKSLSNPLNEANMESGEVVERIPPNKTSKSSFKITLAK